MEINISTMYLFSCFIFQLIGGVKLMTVYMDRYGDCNRDSYISVKDEEYTIRSQGGDPYDTTLCEMVFKSEKNDRLCLSFKKFIIDRCDLKLNMYASQSATGTAIGNYDCKTSEVPESLCSSGHYLTVQLKKEELSHDGYSFNLEVREFTSSDAFADGLDVFIVSIGVIVAIIVGVIVLVVIAAVIIVYCCCKNKHYGLTHTQSRKSTSYRTAATDVPVEPSAPPIEEHPPAYCEPPPPYTTTDSQSAEPSVILHNGQDATQCLVIKETPYNHISQDIPNSHTEEKSVFV